MSVMLYVILRNSNEIVYSHITQVHTILSHTGDMFKNLYSSSWLYSYINSELKSPQIGDSTHLLQYLVSLTLLFPCFFDKNAFAFVLPRAMLVSSSSHSHYVTFFCLFLFFTRLWSPLKQRLSLVYLCYQKKQQAWLLSTHCLKGIRRVRGLLSSRFINVSKL